MGNGNKPALCLGGDITSSLKVAYRRHSPERRLVKSSQALCSSEPSKSVRGCSALWRGASPDDGYSSNMKRWQKLRAGRGVGGVKQCWPAEID